MKNLRSLLLPAALSAALLAPAAVFAQQASAPPAAQGWHHHGRHHGFMHMMRGVNLTDQQKAQIRQIMQQFRQAHPRGSQMDQTARRQAHQQLHRQLMNVLTPQQRAQVQQNIEQMRLRRQQRGGDRSWPSPRPSASPTI